MDGDSTHTLTMKNVCFNPHNGSIPSALPPEEDDSRLFEIAPAMEPLLQPSKNVSDVSDIVPEETSKSSHNDVAFTAYSSPALDGNPDISTRPDASESMSAFSSNEISPTSIVHADTHAKACPPTSDGCRTLSPDVHSDYFHGLGDTQSLYRRTHSTPTTSVSNTVSPGVVEDVLSELHPDSEANTTPDDDGQSIVQSVMSQTHCRMHLKETDKPPFSIQTSISEPPKSVSAPKSEKSSLLSSSSSEASATEISKQPKSLLDYTRYLMGMDFSADMQSDSDPIEDAWTVATKRRGVYNLIQVPVRLERLLSFVMFICADEFLSMFTFLPLRALFAVLKFLWFIFCLPLRIFLRGERGRRQGLYPPSVQKLHTKARTGNVIDALHFSILVITSMFLALFDISWVYHNIRGQSVIKLYVVFNVLEIFDRLCSSFGVDILDSLGWTTASAVTFLSREQTRDPGSEAQSGSATRARAVQSVWLLSRVAFDYIFTLVYTGLHAALLLTWVVTLNVAINTKNNALITLLIANNFVELKGSVFKSYKVQNVFQIACSDGVERFQLTIFLLIMLVYTAGNNGLLRTWIIVYVCEVIVDWIKHAFVTKFNRIPHRVYPQFSIVICEDIGHARSHSVVRSVGGSAVSKRIGFVSLPLGALSARMAASTIGGMPFGAALLLFATMVATKVALSIGLMGHAHRRLHRAAEQQNDWPNEEEELESKWYQSLLNVGRYDLITKS